MAKKYTYFKNQHQTEISKILRSISQTHGLWQVFKDFVAMSALAISNSVDRANYVTREAEYMAIVKRYNKQEANQIAEAFAHIAFGLEEGMADFLGSLFMALELGDSWKGQFFTPYEISVLMATLTIGDKDQELERKGFITVCDPTIGGGAMIVAAADALQRSGRNYQQCMHATGVDIDIVSVHMAYIQCSLLHIPAIIYHGNSLSNEIWSEWKTPAHVLGFWGTKLKRAEEAQAQNLTTQELVEVLEQSAYVAQIRVSDPQEPAPHMFTQSPDVNIRGQFSLF